MTVLSVTNVSKVYGKDKTAVKALDNIHLDVHKGEFLAVMGTSGSGKSTLLNIISGLDRPTAGEVSIKGKNIIKYPDRELTTLRREQIGFIFQFFNLIPVLSAIENVTLPALLSGIRPSDIQDKAKELLEIMGIGALAHSKPSELSGGQQQRVAIARALINDPEFILADEPTGSLDSKTSKEVMTILQKFCTEMNHTLVLVTHDARVASYADRVIFMQDGRIANRLDLQSSSLTTNEKVGMIMANVEGISV